MPVTVLPASAMEAVALQRWSSKTSDMPDIRLAVKADAERISALSRQTFIDSFAADNTAADMEIFLNTQFTASQLEAQVGQPFNHFFITWEQDEPLGYMRLIEHPGGHPDFRPGIPSFEISRFYAVKNAIGKGIGPM